MILLVFCVFSLMGGVMGATQSDCVEGQFWDGTACTKCPLNTFSPRKAASSCYQCFEDYITRTEGAKSADECVCENGYERPIYFEPCRKCRPGTYNDGTVNSTLPAHYQGMCHGCPAGYTTLEAGATDASDCSACSPGYYASGGTCTACAKGYYSDTVDATSCTSCPTGQTTYHTGSTRPWDCHDKCGPGRYNRRGWGGCNDCPRGTYSTGDNNDDCTPCAEGLTTDQRGSTSETDCVIECSHGYVRNGDVCEQCPAGKYFSYTYANFGYGQGYCEDCPTGTTTLEAGATNPDQCVCTAGYYGNERYTWRGYQKECLACALGTYSDTAGADSCTACAEWMTTTTTAATAASDCVCEAGTYMDPTENVCVMCGVGTFSFGGTTRCGLCPTGSTTLREGATSSDACVCQAGYFSNPASGECEVCPANSYTDDVGRTICIRCPIGKTHSIDHTGCE